jgi:hypothetical protein
MNQLLQRKYLVLLLTLSMLFIGYPILHGIFSGRPLFDVLLTLVFVAALLVLFTERRLRLLALVLGVPTVVGAWTHYVLPGLPRPPVVIGFHLVATLFLGFVITTVLREVYQAETVSSDSIYGAFGGYLLVGVAFGHLYCVVETLLPGSFRGGEEFMAQLQSEDQRHFLLTYFSLVTLTTVGYGDITPAKEAARGLALAEAVLGQFYIAGLIAALIGKRVAQVLSDRQPDSRSGRPR